MPLFVPLALPDEFVPKRTMANARETSRLAKGSQHFLWRKNRNATEPAEILDIERKQVLDFMHMHRCYQARASWTWIPETSAATTILRHS